MTKLVTSLSLSLWIVYAPLNSAAAPKTNDPERGESVRIQTKANPLLKEFKRGQAIYVKRNFGTKSCQEYVERKVQETLEKQLAEQGFDTIPQPEDRLSQLPYFSLDQRCGYDSIAQELARVGTTEGHGMIQLTHRKTVDEYKPPFMHPSQLTIQIKLMFPHKNKKKIPDDERIAWLSKYSHSYKLDVKRSADDLSTLIQRIVQQAVAAFAKDIDKNEKEAAKSKENNSGNTAAPTARL